MGGLVEHLRGRAVVHAALSFGERSADHDGVLVRPPRAAGQLGVAEGLQPGNTPNLAGTTTRQVPGGLVEERSEELLCAKAGRAGGTSADLCVCGWDFFMNVNVPAIL